jgi:anaerobic ribonucleoside-triphosphate reductase
MSREFLEFMDDYAPDDATNNSVFGSILEELDSCPNCGYQGPPESSRRGYTCPECKYLLLESE